VRGEEKKRKEKRKEKNKNSCALWRVLLHDVIFELVFM
jgi:hypothetical protein